MNACHEAALYRIVLYINVTVLPDAIVTMYVKPETFLHSLYMQ